MNFSRSSIFVRAALWAVFLTSAVPAAAAPTDFYPLAQRWAKARAESAGKEEAVEGAFQKAVQSGASSVPSDPFGTPIPALRRPLSGIAPAGESIELESGQTLFISSDAPITKSASTDDTIAELQSADASTLAVTAREVGKTVVHVWDASGRRTFEVRVVPRKFTGPTYADLKRDQIQKTRPFKVHFAADGGTFETGPRFGDLRRNSLEETEVVSVDGDTPYGLLDAHMQVQRSGVSTKNIVSDAQVALYDGHVGPVKNFNAAVGDSPVKPDFLAFSRGRIRGVAGDHWTDDKRFAMAGFFGREQAGIFAPLSPSATTGSKRTLDSFLSGTTAQYRPNDDLKMKAGYFTGYGKSRPDELNRQGMAFSAEANATPYLTLLPEIDYDSEHVAHLHALKLKGDKSEVRAEFRNINENFQSMIGAPAQQGELGGRLDATLEPWKYWRWRGMLDVFNDRRIPNPEMPDARNIHAESELVYEVGDGSELAFTWRDWDDTGRVSPTRERLFGLQYTESFRAFDRTIGVNIRGNNRRSRFLTQTLSDYDRNELHVGVFFPIFRDIRFSAQKEWHWLDDVNLEDGHSRPEALTLALGYSHRLWESPFYLDVDLRWRDEEETESPNSFMSGEDSTELSAALYYRENENMELYLKGQLQNFNPENGQLTENRVEGQVLAGMRWDWDTGFRWTGVGHVQGSVFKDENRNGARDLGEPGMPGIAVQSAAGHKALTDPDGRYEIRGIADRAAIITVEATHLPAGYVPTADVVRETAIEPGKTVTLDFGFAPRSEAGGLVFNDLNGNGRFEPSEPGVPRVRVKLDGKPQSSSSSGSYAFRSLAAGPHALELDLSSVTEGYLPSETAKKNFELTEGMRYEWNVPLRAYRVVSGRVFRDRDGNGSYSSPEDEPVRGAEVELGTFRQATDEEGRFLFDNLPAGHYELKLGQVEAGDKPAAMQIVDLGNEPETRSGLDIAVVKSPSA